MGVKTLLFFLIFSICSCMVHSQLKLNQVKYLGYSYKSTFNKSFVNKQFKFLNKKDTIFINLRVPFDSSKNNITNEGLFYSCQLAKDSLYSFTLKKTSHKAIPAEWNSYYRINALFLNGAKKSKFREVKKNTDYLYVGNYGKFVDIKNELYEILLLSPTLNCVLQH